MFNKLLLIYCITALSIFIYPVKCQSISDAVLKKQWNAYWISVPGELPNAYGVYLFRKKIDLKIKPSSFIIHVSADNRYKLYVNGKLVSLGPARGDIDHWNFETIDIASYLHTSNNVIAALVWNDGDYRAEFQISLRTGFILQGNDSAEQIINTNASWKCIRDSSYRPTRLNLPTYYVAGPGELIDMHQHIKNWLNDLYYDSLWKNAKQISRGTPKNMVGPFTLTNGWMLIPSSIPQMELKDQRLLQIRRSSGVTIPSPFPAEKKSVTIPANTVATILLDQTFLTNAYPVLTFSKGKGAGVSISYAEALFTKYPEKGNRNDIEGKIFLGRKDSIVSDGSNNQQFVSLLWRTYRYVQIRITTQSDPFILEDFYGTFTGYPFQFNAKLGTENTEIRKMLDIGWRTARLCANETYMDCPYYEQLQYIGDSRIQGLVSLYNSGDDRLLRNALNLIDNSRQPEGLTESRHPSYTTQYIPTFSLWYIGMLHDYWMYGKDSNFIKNKLPGTRMVLNYFNSFQDTDGSLKDCPFWVFTDWVEKKDWIAGVGPIGKDGTSALLDLQLLWAYQLAADMENRIGLKELAIIYNNRADQLKNTIVKKYWVENRKLFADREEKDLFSQHANTLAILTGIISDPLMSGITNSLLQDTTLAPASIYFKYYLHRALIKAGLGNDYLGWLDIWRKDIDMGLTTWAEISDVNAARSDCHAWGASPNIEFFRTVLGIDSYAPSFSEVTIEPHLGNIKNINGEIPHPKGKIVVNYKYINNKWDIQISLPEKITGRFIWKGKEYHLKEGSNSLEL
ncbi:MAG: alpha-L-rhamnosidase N-terminal domain-containing protein [Flavisolibacter sp.]